MIGDMHKVFPFAMYKHTYHFPDKPETQEIIHWCIENFSGAWNYFKVSEVVISPPTIIYVNGYACSKAQGDPMIILSISKKEDATLLMLTWG
jgi:hypothetical protein